MVLTGPRESGGAGGTGLAYGHPSPSASGAGGLAASRRVTDVQSTQLDSLITACGWGVGYDNLHLRRIFVVEV